MSKRRRKRQQASRSGKTIYLLNCEICGAELESEIPPPPEHVIRVSPYENLADDVLLCERCFSDSQAFDRAAR